jgi:hypothetical protein
VAPSAVDASWIQCYSEEFLTYTDLLVLRFVADNQIGSTAATKGVAKARKATMKTERKSLIACVLHLVAESKLLVVLNLIKSRPNYFWLTFN